MHKCFLLIQSFFNWLCCNSRCIMQILYITVLPCLFLKASVVYDVRRCEDQEELWMLIISTFIYFGNGLVKTYFFVIYNIYLLFMQKAIVYIFSITLKPKRSSSRIPSYYLLICRKWNQKLHILNFQNNKWYLLHDRFSQILNTAICIHRLLQHLIHPQALHHAMADLLRHQLLQ